MSLIRNAFSRLHYPIDVIAQCVHWYLAYALSLRHLEEMMAERGIVVDHSTIRKGPLQHPDGEGLFPAEQFYLLAAEKTGSATFANFSALMRQSQISSFLLCNSTLASRHLWQSREQGGEYYSKRVIEKLP
ncbi:Uncharacterised protein [Yersinia rohdei]|nr:Uncharacterised protein [Yersinia rohdei]